jgi:MFS family permease
VIGNAFEWYDFAIYAYMTPIIDSVFFPVNPHDPSTQINALLATTAVFGVGFLTRPIGGVVLGIVGDKYGRATGMVAGMTLMAVAIAMMVFAPSYGTAGLLAPAIVVSARLLQGFSLGGQFGTSTSYLIEMAPEGKSGLYGSWQMFGQLSSFALGTAMGAGLTHFFTSAQIQDGLWRIPFAFGLVIIPVAWYIRRYVDEPESFKRVKESLGSDARISLKGHGRQLASSIGLVATSAVSFYAIYGYTVTYAKTALHLAESGAFAVEFISAAFMLLVIPFAGTLCDRFRRARKHWLVGLLSVYLAVMYPAYSWLTAAPTLSKLLAVQLVVSLVSGLFLGIFCTTMSEQFPAEIRSTSLSVANNISVMIFGGFAQFFLTWIYKATQSQIAPVYYVMGGIAAGLIGALLLPSHQEVALSPAKTCSNEFCRDKIVNIRRR